MRKRLGLALALIMILTMLSGCWLRSALDPEGSLKKPRVQKADKPEKDKK